AARADAAARRRVHQPSVASAHFAIIIDRSRPMELDILFEDDALMVVNKPAGIVVHPTYRNASGTLLDALRAHASGGHEPDNPAIVGRLDKYTSGIVVVAKTAAHHASLQRILQSLDSEKDYLAVV